jgi:hypothetical protein
LLAPRRGAGPRAALQGGATKVTIRQKGNNGCAQAFLDLEPVGIRDALQRGGTKATIGHKGNDGFAQAFLDKPAAGARGLNVKACSCREWAGAGAPRELAAGIGTWVVSGKEGECEGVGVAPPRPQMEPQSRTPQGG